ncbi:phage portal protein [Kribbella sp. NBC_01505]|uniref:phage portal protein n=1 Tax=Kribbella sp. NBC_01505 TaxID=2903580 RepID=UPI0038639DC9
MANVKARAVELLAILHNDRPALRRYDRYVEGKQDDPYMPANADDEYKLLAERAKTNVMPLLTGAPAQALYVDDFRPGNRSLTSTSSGTRFEMKHWQWSRMDARQSAIYRAAFKFGHSFTLTEKTKKRRARTKSLSALSTAALYEDPANDETPLYAITITSEPRTVKDEQVPGKARLFDGKFEYPVTFKSLTDEDGITVGTGIAHGASECPVTRFACHVDTEGRTTGLVEPMIAVQNRINQTVFDLLVAQTYASFKVRWVTGMAPPMLMQGVDENGNPTRVEADIVDWVPVRDANGNEVPAPMNHNARRFLFAEDTDTKFGSLDETPLDGFIASIDMSFRHMAALSQTPPHHLLGQIANLSAEALLAAETAFSRMVEEFRKGFGEAWERVFRLAAEMDGDADAADDFEGETLWRDMEQRSLAQAADALGKLREQLGIPKRGLWPRVPNVTRTELDQWEDLADEEDAALAMSQAVSRATTNDTTSFRSSTPARVLGAPPTAKAAA